MRKRRPRLSPLGREVLKGLAEMQDHMRGKIALPTRKVPDLVDVRAIRRGVGLTRPAFAARFGLDIRAVQDWEQGRRQPDRAARVLLTVISAEPEAIDRALLGAVALLQGLRGMP